MLAGVPPVAAVYVGAARTGSSCCPSSRSAWSGWCRSRWPVVPMPRPMRPTLVENKVAAEPSQPPLSRHLAQPRGGDQVLVRPLPDLERPDAEPGEPVLVRLLPRIELQVPLVAPPREANLVQVPLADAERAGFPAAVAEMAGDPMPSASPPRPLSMLMSAVFGRRRRALSGDGAIVWEANCYGGGSAPHRQAVTLADYAWNMWCDKRWNGARPLPASRAQAVTGIQVSRPGRQWPGLRHAAAQPGPGQLDLSRSAPVLFTAHETHPGCRFTVPCSS